MESKRRTSTPKNTHKRESTSKGRSKKSASPALRDSKAKLNVESVPSLLAHNKKKTGQHLVKKKIE